MQENTAATLSAFVAGAVEDTVKQLADPDADKNIIAYLRGALGAFLLVKAKLEADAAECVAADGTEAAT
jgi:hypothetical protein